eukprot:COSAG04_NODE_31172_length_258_cov_0.654088_1_plen_24_part_10
MRAERTGSGGAVANGASPRLYLYD